MSTRPDCWRHPDIGVAKQPNETLSKRQVSAEAVDVTTLATIRKQPRTGNSLCRPGLTDEQGCESGKTSYEKRAQRHKVLAGRVTGLCDGSCASRRSFQSIDIARPCWDSHLPKPCHAEPLELYVPAIKFTRCVSRSTRPLSV